MIESIRLALQGIMANRLRSALTMLGILIGVAAVILLIAVGAGSSAAVQNQLAGLGTNTLTVFPTGGFGGGGPGGANRTGTVSRQARLTAKDVTALEDKTNAPDVAEVAPVVNVERDRDLRGRDARHRPGSSARRPTTSRSATSRSRAAPRSAKRT